MMEEIVMTVKHQNNLEYIESRDFILVKMAEGGGNERQLLGQYVQKQTKYGTATRLSPKSSTYIKHAVVESDTLMGIALKYGVTVEQLKRENKIWTNDSLFLRDSLLIPVAIDDIPNLSSDVEIITVDNTSNRPRSNSQMSNGSVHIENETKTTDTNKCESDNSAMDFLNKYDSSIAQLKSHVKKMEKNARFLRSEDENPLTVLPRKHSYDSKSIGRSDLTKSSHRRSQDYPHISDAESSPVLMIKSRSTSKQVMTSIEKSERANEELFQL